MLTKEIEDCENINGIKDIDLTKGQAEFLAKTCEAWVEFFEYTQKNKLDPLGETYLLERTKMSLRIKQSEDVLIMLDKDGFHQLFQEKLNDLWKRSIFDQFMDKLILRLSKMKEFSNHPEVLMYTRELAYWNDFEKQEESKGPLAI